MGQSGSTTLDHEDHLPRYQGPIDDEPQQRVMDGYCFQADYFGFTTISKPPTALSIIQPPVKELYIKCRKQGGGVNVKQIVLRVIPGGLIFTFLDSTHRDEVFFDINSMIYFEGLKFQMVRTNEKKPHAMFVPLDESKLTPKDQKSAFVLDKNSQFLAQEQHPPLLACVLRRPKGIKALDCHLFVFRSLSDVHQIKSLLDGVHASGGKLPEISDFRQTETNFNKGQKGDIIRTEYGDYAIYRGNQMELKDDFFRPREENGAFDDRREDRREDRRDDRREERHDDRYDVRREQDKKAPDWEYDSSPIDNAWRSVQKQFTNEELAKNVDPSQVEYRRHEQERADNQFVAHSRDKSGDGNDARYGGRNNDSDRGRYDERQYRDSPRLNPKIPPPVADKPSSPRPLSPSGQRFPGGGYGVPPSRDESRGNQYNPRYAPGPINSGGAIYSASNLEGRRIDRNSKGDEDMPPKPVAKVPPHLVAGIKVLPTNFNPQGVKLKPRSSNHEKGIEIHTEKTFSPDSSDDHEYDNVLQKFDKMISDETTDSIHGKPTQHDREMYDHNVRKNWANEDTRQNRESPRPERQMYGQDYDRYNGPDDRRYIEQYEYQKHNNDLRPDCRGDPKGDPKSTSNRYSMPQMYERDERSYESPSRWSGSNKSQSSYEMGGRSPGQPSGVTPENPDHNRKKDAEIANMFEGHHRDRGDNFGYRPLPAGTNFEQSLGYYP